MDPIVSLAGRTLIVTGAGQGIGKAITELGIALGANVVDEIRYRDHHRFTPAELAAADAAARTHSALLLTTEKDDARMLDSAHERFVLRIGLHFLEGAPTAHDLGLP